MGIFPLNSKGLGPWMAIRHVFIVFQAMADQFAYEFIGLGPWMNLDP